MGTETGMGIYKAAALLRMRRSIDGILEEQSEGQVHHDRELIVVPRESWNAPHVRRTMDCRGASFGHREAEQQND